MYNNLKTQVKKIKNGKTKYLRKMIYWKIRWLFSEKPMELKLLNKFNIISPKCGEGALIYYNGISEPLTYNFIKNNLKKGDIFYDIGAHLGEFSILAGELVGYDGEVHAFEPIPYIYKYLIFNTKKINNTTFILNNKVVSDKSGVVEFEIFNEPSISRISVKNEVEENKSNTNKLSVDSITIDQYTVKQKIPTMIKIDVEGAELLVLKGMKKLLELNKEKAPIITLELLESNFENFGYSSKNVIEFLQNYKYKLYDVKGNAINNLQNYEGLIENNIVAIKI